MSLTDTHCHIHESDPSFTAGSESRMKWEKAGRQQPDEIIADAIAADVTKMICVGTTLADSQQAIRFVADRAGLWASIGIHPHEASSHLDEWEAFAALVSQPKVVAIGECGLDYFYEHSSPADQKTLLHKQLELAVSNDKPVIFHTREAFDDFWPIFDSYQGVRGVLHSFTDSADNLERALARGLYIGVNGIVTFAKQAEQLAMYRSIPLENLVLETDAPYLTPIPFRGKICEPKHVSQITNYLAQLRGEQITELAAATSKNAGRLFDI